MNLVRVEAISWNRFLTRNFAVVPELLGRSHEFQFQQGIVCIELPTRPDLSTSDISQLLPSHRIIIGGNDEKGIRYYYDFAAATLLRSE
jgi:hypothetical protein